MNYGSEAVSFLRYSFVYCQHSATSSKLHWLPLSSPSRAVNSGCRSAKREQDESPCGDLVSETATRWRPRSEAPLWVSSDFLNVSVNVRWCKLVRLMYEQLSSVWLLGDRGGTHFTTRDLKSMGFSFCDTLLDFCDPDPSKVRVFDFYMKCKLFPLLKQGNIPLYIFKAWILWL